MNIIVRWKGKDKVYALQIMSSWKSGCLEESTSGTEFSQFPNIVNEICSLAITLQVINFQYGL